MQPTEYYKRIFPKLKETFEDYHFMISSGKLLVDKYGFKPDFPIAVETVDKLKQRTTQDGLDVYMPVIQSDSESVLFPFDYEIFMGDNQYLLYANEAEHKALFKEHMLPMVNRVQQTFNHYNMPFIHDLTPSGGHIIFRVGTDEWNNIGNALEKLGKPSNECYELCSIKKNDSLTRKFGVSDKATRIFGGITRIAQYIGMQLVDYGRNNHDQGEFISTISDNYDMSINVDLSWVEGTPFMRSLRAPRSLHSKNSMKYGYDKAPLVDIIAGYGNKQLYSIEHLLDGMHNLGIAAEVSNEYPGKIPFADDTGLKLVADYMASDVYAFHKEFDESPDVPIDEAIATARFDSRLLDTTKDVLNYPNYRLLQPKMMKRLIEDFLSHQYKPRFIANIFEGAYKEDHNWDFNFTKYSAQEKAQRWAEMYSLLTLYEWGQIKIKQSF